jgi:transposase
MVPAVESRHDNERPHAVACTLELLEQFKWETFEHAPYSPDLAPSDHHLFLHLKTFLAGRSLRSDQETNTVVHDKLAITSFDKGIQTLVQRYDSCSNLQRN